MGDPFSHEIISYLLKILLTGVGAISAVAVCLQLYFRRAIVIDEGKVESRKQLQDSAISANSLLLNRFEKDVGLVQEEMAKMRVTIGLSNKVELALQRQMVHLQAEVKGLRAQVRDQEVKQSEFSKLMEKFILSLRTRKKDLPGGLVRISEDTDDEKP